MKILFLTTELEDYLQDTFLHGFRTLLGNDLVDYPQKNILYKGFNRQGTYGKGFTIYNLLENIEVDRDNIDNKLKNNFFDIIIFGSIQRQYDLFVHFRKYLVENKTLIFDGEDSPILFPNHREYKKNPFLFFQKRIYKRFKYFKRELTPESNNYRFFKVLPSYLTNKIPLPKHVFPISFSIPDEKIVEKIPIKTKIFPKHIVDEEVASNVEGSNTKYAFENESDYYTDLQTSQYGITTKRAGWDCMRHYEIAANGTVICFRDLDKKPVNCAPHGLIPNVNCLLYKNYDDLMSQISKISDEKYIALQSASLNWIKNNTTINSASKLIDNFNESNEL